MATISTYTGVIKQGQIADGYCLAACTQMVLHYLGILIEQTKIAKQLGIWLAGVVE